MRSHSASLSSWTGSALWTAFSDLDFPVLGIAHNDEQVWIRLRMRGRHTGPFVRFRDGALDQAIHPTGRDIDFEQNRVLDLRDGKVVGHAAVRDDVAVLGRLRVFPPSPAVGLSMLTWRVTEWAARAAADVTAKAAEAAAGSAR
ncbi:ester cyclase [Streptomyces prunicolor]|uniref:ester cyclase n=1 Tax=Streptomyces prunicolor TaxID=67348 RepID=UPI00371AF194